MFALLFCSFVLYAGLFVVFMVLFLLFVSYTFLLFFCFFFSSRRRHTRCLSDWSSDVCSSDLAVLQLRPYQEPYIPIAVASVQSPAGVQLAGKYGASVLSLSIPRATVRQTSLQELWAIGEEAAAAHGKVLRREDWRLVVPCHVAESRQEAMENVRLGGGREVTEYCAGTLGNPTPDVPREK